MEAKSYSRLTAAIFAIIALLQLVRALSGWDITFNGIPGLAPVWWRGEDFRSRYLI
jgi:hypothetical protein